METEIERIKGYGDTICIGDLVDVYFVRNNKPPVNKGTGTLIKIRACENGSDDIELVFENYKDDDGDREEGSRTYMNLFGHNWQLSFKKRETNG